MLLYYAIKSCSTISDAQEVGECPDSTMLLYVYYFPFSNPCILHFFTHFQIIYDPYAIASCCSTAKSVDLCRIEVTKLAFRIH